METNIVILGMLLFFIAREGQFCAKTVLFMTTDQESAYILFKEGVPQTEISRIFRKTEQTISRWKRDGKWDKRVLDDEMNERTVQEDAGELLRYQLRTLKKIKNELEEEEAKPGGKPQLISKGHIDGIRDLFNVTRQKEIEWTGYVKTGREFMKFVKENDLPLAQALAPVLDDFLNFKRKAQ